jgi:hypothetical protein
LNRRHFLRRTTIGAITFACLFGTKLVYAEPQPIPGLPAPIFGPCESPQTWLAMFTNHRLRRIVLKYHQKSGRHREHRELWGRLHGFYLTHRAEVDTLRAKYYTHAENEGDWLLQAYLTDQRHGFTP